MKGQLSFKPGTVALAIFIAIVGYIAFTLVSANVNQLGETAREDQDAAMDCSELDVQFINIDQTDDGVEVFFRINTDLQGVEVGLENSNETDLVENVKANQLHNASLNVSSYSRVYIDTGRCNNPFWSR